MYSTDSLGVRKQFDTSLPKAVAGWLSSPASACYVHSGLLAPSSLMCLFLSCFQLFATAWTSALQAPLSMGILQARILQWVAMPSSRDLPNPGTESRSPTLKVDSLLSETPGKPLWV